MHITIKHICICLLLLPVLWVPQIQAEDSPSDEASNGTTNDDSTGCKNKTPCITGGPVKGYCCPGIGSDNAQESGVCSPSWYGWVAREHRHDALDYMPDGDGFSQGCAPCGSTGGAPDIGRLPALTFWRHHRPRHGWWHSVVGGWQFTEYDAHISISPTSWRTGPNGEDVPVARLVLMELDGGSHLLWEDSVEHNDAVNDGVYHDENILFKSLTFYADTDYSDTTLLSQPTAASMTATVAVLRGYGGKRWVFEMFTGNNDNRIGRLIRVEDRNNNAVRIQHMYAADSTDAELGGTPSPTHNPREKFWVIDTITDAYGRTAAMHYDPGHLAGTSPSWGGQIPIQAITWPNGTQTTYEQNGGNLTKVVHPDGTESNFTYDHTIVNGAVDAVQVTYDDAASKGTHRRKVVYYATDATIDPVTGQVTNLTRGLIKRAETMDGETILKSWDNATVGAEGLYVYLGGNQLHYYRTKGDTVTGQAIATDYIFDPNNDPDVSNLTWKTVYDGTRIAGHEALGDKTDTYNRAVALTWDVTGRYISGFTYPDGTTKQITRNDFFQKTLEVDRLGRVTQCTYDSNGNRLTKTVGLDLDGSGYVIDLDPSDTSTWSWTYNARGQMDTATDANGNVTNYTYDNNGYLITITEPADVSGGTRAEQLFAYNSSGLLIQQTDPLGRTTQFAYDNRNRVTTITYADTSAEQFVYGSGAQDANLVVQKTDRTGINTNYIYDSYGRTIQTQYAAGLPESVEETCTYLSGTSRKLSCVKSGELTTYSFDYRNRVIGVSRQANTQTTLSTHSEFDVLGRRLSTTDAYGRSTFYLYDINDRLVVQIQETIPQGVEGAIGTLPSAEAAPVGGLSGSGAPGVVYATSVREEALAGLTRVLTANAPYLITNYNYDSIGQLTQVTDGRGNIQTYTYDQQGRRIQSIEAAGTSIAAQTEVIYDAQGNVIVVRSPRYFDSTDSNGYQQAQTTRTYTGRNLLATETVADGSAVAATRSSTYFLDGRKQSDTDFRGNTIDYAWGFCCARFQASIDPAVTLPDGSGPERPAHISRHNDYGDRTHEAVVRDYDGTVFPTFVDPQNVTDLPDAATVNEMTTIYDGLHRPLAKTVWLSPRGAVDANNPPIAGDNGIPSSEGLTTRWTYDDDLTDGVGLDVTYASYLVGLNLGSGSDGKAVAVTNPENETSVTIYDGFGRVVKTIDGLGDANSMTYDTFVTIAGFGDVVETTAADALGHTNKSRTDAAGRRIQGIDAENHITNYSYDANNNLIAYRDPNNVGQDCVFDERNRDVSCTDTQGDTTARSYDAQNNVIAMTDALNQTTSCVFDARDRKVNCTDRINATTTYAYDANNNLISITDAEGSITTYSYDVRNLLDQETFPAGHAGTTQKAYAYDAARRLTSRLVNTVEAPLTSETTNYAYDMANRMTTRAYPDEVNGDDTFTYDAASRLLTAHSNRYSNTVTRTYDDDSKLITETLNIDGTNYPITYVYDVADRQTGITYPNGIQVVRSYTDRNQLLNVSYDSTVLSTSDYDAGMRETNRIYSNGVNTVKTYRNDNLISDIDVTKGETNILDFTYAYDANKRKLTETDALRADASQTFNYDNEDRLTNWGTESGVTNQLFALSPVGDWDSTVRTGTDPINEIRTHTAVHEVTAINGNSLNYDFKGNLASNVQNAQDYIWDAENRMKSISNSVDADYRYDALGRRVQKSVTENSVITTTTFVCGGAQVFMEYVDSVESQSYVYASYVDEPIALIAAGGTTSYYHANHLYSIEAITDNAGALVETYDYSSHGKLTIKNSLGAVQTSSIVNNPYGFTGRRLDAESGLSYYRKRYFDYNLGRFISRDPAEYGSNHYKYYGVGNATDPSGQYPYYVGAAGGGMASGALWSFGLGVDIDMHAGGVVVAGGRGGCMANYWHVNASIKFEMGPSDWTVTDFQLGSGGGAESLALTNTSYIYAGVGLAYGPKCPRELEGTSARYAIMVNIAKTGGFSIGGSGYKSRGMGIVDGVFAGGFYGGFAGKATSFGGGTVRNAVLKKMGIPLSWSGPKAFSIVFHGNWTWTNCWDMCFDNMPCEPVEREEGGSGGGTVGTPPPVTKPKTGGGTSIPWFPEDWGWGRKILATPIVLIGTGGMVGEPNYGGGGAW